MHELKITERKSVVGNFTVRKNAKGEKRYAGTYYVLKRTTTNCWGVYQADALGRADKYSRLLFLSRADAMEWILNDLEHEKNDSEDDGEEDSIFGPLKPLGFDARS